MKKPLLHRSEFLSDNKVTKSQSPLGNLLNVTSILNVVFDLTVDEINARIINVEMEEDFDYSVDIIPFYTDAEKVDGALSFARYLQLFNVLVKGQHQFKADFEELQTIVTAYLETNQHN